MLDILAEFEVACEDMGQLQAILKQALAKTTDPTFREHLQQVEAEIAKALAEVKESFPKAVAELDADIAATQQSLKEGEAEIAALEKELAAAEEAEAALPTPPPPPRPLDADRWETMRRELLERFGPRPAAAALTGAGEEVVDMESGDFQSMAHRPVRPAPPSPPAAGGKPTLKADKPAAKEPGGEDDMLDMTSGQWKVDE
jgi:hypothetical protein